MTRNATQRSAKSRRWRTGGRRFFNRATLPAPPRLIHILWASPSEPRGRRRPPTARRVPRGPCSTCRAHSGGCRSPEVDAREIGHVRRVGTERFALRHLLLAVVSAAVPQGVGR